MKRLEDKRTVITGAAGEIAADLARKCVNEGAKVHLVDINEDGLKGLVAELGEERAAFTVADVSSEDATRNYVKEAKDKWGGIDVFFNNAGVEGKAGVPLTEITEKDWDRVMNINVKGMWFGIKYVAPVMAEGGGGAIVMTASVASLGAFPGLGPYVTSKHAIVGLMKTAAVELASKNIRVNSVNPSPVDTRMMRSIESGSGDQTEMEKTFTAAIPMGRYAKTQEVANLLFYLATDEASFLTGGVYLIDGGSRAL